MNEDVEQVQEWLRQLNLIYSGLIVIGVYLVQPFLTAGTLDLSARVCVIAFSVAIPLLAAGLAAVAVHSAGYAGLEGYRWRPAEDGGERRDAGS